MLEHPNYNLDSDAANALLNNVLDSCNIPPSSKTIEEVVLKRELERKPISILKYIAIVFLVLSVLAPLCFNKDPQFSVIEASKTVAVTSHTLYEDCFVMTLSGDADYGNINSRKNDGALIFPDKIDEASGLVIFPYNGEALNIYIPTKSGGCIQAVLNEIKK